MVTRGEVWLAALDPAVGGEIQKTSPCLIISPAELNNHLRTVTVAPMTSSSHPAGFRIPLTFQGISGLILLDESRALDKKRLIKRLGTVPAAVLRQALRTMRELYEE